jgi:hypothetical protein
MTDVDEGVLTDATYTIEKRDAAEPVATTIKEEASTAENNKKVSFKGDEEVPKEVETKIAEIVAPPVECSQPCEELTLKAPTPLPEVTRDDLLENLPPRPKSQTPESIGSFTVLEDGDDAEQKLKEFEEMTQDDSGYRQQGEEEDSEEQQFFKEDQDSGIEPSPRAQRGTKIPAPRFSHSSVAGPTTRRSFIVPDDRPRSTRIEGRKPGDKNACNMTTVTQSIQKNIRR